MGNIVSKYILLFTILVLVVLISNNFDNNDIIVTKSKDEIVNTDINDEIDIDSFIEQTFNTFPSTASLMLVVNDSHTVYNKYTLDNNGSIIKEVITYIPHNSLTLQSTLVL